MPKKKGRLTFNETYKPVTPVMVTIPGRLVGLTVKPCPPKKIYIVSLELLKDAKTEI